VADDYLGGAITLGHQDDLSETVAEAVAHPRCHLAPQTAHATPAKDQARTLSELRLLYVRWSPLAVKLTSYNLLDLFNY